MYDGGALLDVVGLQAVAGHLVKEDTAEAAADDHGHRPGRRGVGIEQLQRHLGCALGDRLGGAAVDKLEAAMATERLHSGLDPLLAPGDDLDREADPGAIVGGKTPFGVGDQDPPSRLQVAGLDLGHLVARGARPLVAGAKQVGLALGRDHVGIDRDLLRLGGLGGAQRRRLRALA